MMILISLTPSWGTKTERRMDTQYLIRFKDQEEVWWPYDYSIFQLQAYEQFCNLRPELRFLL
jgi:hypothetical protein